MKRLKIILPLLLALLLLAAAAWAEEAEDLTAGCTVKVVDKNGKIKAKKKGTATIKAKVVTASKTYNKGSYENSMPLKYFYKEE